MRGKPDPLRNHKLDVEKKQNNKTMNEQFTGDSVQEKFTSAVKNFEPKLANKLQRLVPFKDGIAELRSKRASYEMITGILSNLGVKVSRFTVTRFCCEVLKESSSRSKSRRKPRRSKEQITCNDPQATLPYKADPPLTTRSEKAANKSTANKPWEPERKIGGGPRIADPKTI